MYSATHTVRREDARKIGTGAMFRDYVPTREDTKWVQGVPEFLSVIGANTCFNEDQTEIYLTLPVDYKFSIRFWDSVKAMPQMLAALQQAELASIELCRGQDRANACWETLEQIRTAIKAAGGECSSFEP